MGVIHIREGVRVVVHGDTVANGGRLWRGGPRAGAGSFRLTIGLVHIRNSFLGRAGRAPNVQHERLVFWQSNKFVAIL